MVYIYVDIVHLTLLDCLTCVCVCVYLCACLWLYTISCVWSALLSVECQFTRCSGVSCREEWLIFSGDVGPGLHQRGDGVPDHSDRLVPLPTPQNSHPLAIPSTWHICLNHDQVELIGRLPGGFMIWSQSCMSLNTVTESQACCQAEVTTAEAD